MCFFGGGSTGVTTQVAAAPRRSSTSNLSQVASSMALKARGIQDTIATSSLGDPDFGSYVKKATLLGSTA